MTAGLTPNQRVIDLDRAQPGTPSSTGFPLLAPYIRTHVDRNRVAGGKRVYDDSRPITERIEYEYEVPGQIIIAIWGHETNYGGYQGDFDLARSLATLAWEGRRRELFAAEFINLLKIADEGFPRSTLVGSWAGAFGNPQFLPSIYLRLAKDGDGDGRADIWASRADTLHSIANYFRDAGWRPGQPWGVEAALPAGFDVGAYAGKIASPQRCAMSMRSSSVRVRNVTPMRCKRRAAIKSRSISCLPPPRRPTLTRRPFSAMPRRWSARCEAPTWSMMTSTPSPCVAASKASPTFSVW